MNGIDVALIVLVLTVATTLVARRLTTPMPVVLAAVGIAFGWAWHLVPALPPVRMEPERVLLVFLPPLLASAAYALPLEAVRRNVGPILFLAVGLVLLTMVGAAGAAHYVLALPWAAAMVLGAIVAPPDPVAATSVGSRTGLPHRLILILEGEGLINDAVAISAYHLSVSAAISAEFGISKILVEISREIPVGIVVGLAVGWILSWLRRNLDDVTLEAALSLLAPFVSYELADRFHGSGVLAVVTFGFLLQKQRLTIATPAARLASRTVWGAVRFVSTALVFLLLGLLIGEVASTSIGWRNVTGGLAVAAVVIALRLAWMHTIPRFLRTVHLIGGLPLPSHKELTVLGWAGMRGVVSLALALALPAIPIAGDVDGRQVIILATFVLIIATLVVQGALLLPLVRWLNLGDPERASKDEERIRARARRAALAQLDRLRNSERLPSNTCDRLRREIESGTLGVATAGEVPGTREGASPVAQLIEIQRMVVERSRAAGRISESLAERLETELDVDVMRLRGDASRLTGEIEE